MRTPSRLAVSLALLIGGLDAPAGFDAPPPTRRQIEADWLRQDAKRFLGPVTGEKVSCEEDAAGGVDGVKDGKWGFHTEHQENPWWQVDLAEVTRLDRVVLYNRCDGMAGRNARILVLISDDGRNFRQVYQHDGTVFYGFTDQQPLAVKLAGMETRFVRLALAGKDYFHLDEVEVFPVGEDRNVAQGKPALQSSTSQWSARHPINVPDRRPAHPFTTVIERGLRLAEGQRLLGVTVDAEASTLQQISDAVKKLPADASGEARSNLYFRAHWTIRKLALSNPLLDFDDLLFVKRAPTMFPHMSDQHYGWWSRPGGGICLLRNFKSRGTESARSANESPDGKKSGASRTRPSFAARPEVVCLTADMPEGSFAGPRRLLRRPEGAVRLLPLLPAGRRPGEGEQGKTT